MPVAEMGQRICSLLPSATEIVYSLGLGDRLVSVTHECDYPPDARTKPQVTANVIDLDGLSSREIDQAVRESLVDGATLYLLDQDQLESLHPDLIFTQELCTVCAVGTREVQTAVTSLPGDPKVISLEPRTLSGVLDSILQVGRLTGTLRRAIEVTDALRDRIRAVQRAVEGLPRVRVLTLEWVDPIYVGGHWVPEMIEMAGGQDVLGRVAEPSREVTWDDVVRMEPEVIIAMPCGFGLDRSREELARTPLPDAWHTLEAVRAGRVFVVDGSSYFNRPGPRLIDGIEIAASILHPEVWASAPEGSFARFE